MSKGKSSPLLCGIKTGTLALVFSCIGVLILALVAKLCGLGDKLLPVLNQVIKILAIAIALLLCVREEKLLAKGAVGAVVFCLLSCLLFLTLGGKFNIGQVALDLVVALAVAVVVCLLKAKRS